jgi:DNA-binding transcriptional ArsR family regulator
MKESGLRSGPAATEIELGQLANVFRLLSDRTRLNILLLLAAGERNVSSLCEELDLPQPTVSHHLGLLRMNNLITNRRSGKQVFYHFNSRVEDGDTLGALRINAERFRVEISRRTDTP